MLREGHCRLAGRLSGNTVTIGEVELYEKVS